VAEGWVLRTVPEIQRSPRVSVKVMLRADSRCNGTVLVSKLHPKSQLLTEERQRMSALWEVLNTCAAVSVEPVSK
jgi:hypothetical protein